MVILNQGITGQAETFPSATLRIDASDSATEAQVTTPGYLNSSKNFGINFNNKMVALVTTSDTYTKWYQVRVAADGVITLAVI